MAGFKDGLTNYHIQWPILGVCVLLFSKTLEFGCQEVLISRGKMLLPGTTFRILLNFTLWLPLYLFKKPENKERLDRGN